MDCANFIFHHSRGKIYGYISETGVKTLLLPQSPQQEIYLLHSAANVVVGERLVRELKLYFSGIPVAFSDIPLDLAETTPFQQAVWKAAQAIPWGKTISYRGLAEQIGKSNAARAVGQALGRNPIPILIPCHRILAKDDRLGGFSAGLDWKRHLLALEGHTQYAISACDAKRPRQIVIHISRRPS